MRKAGCPRRNKALAPNTTHIAVTLQPHVAAFAPLLAEAVFHLPVVDAVVRTEAHDQDHVVMQALAACSSK